MDLATHQRKMLQMFRFAYEPAPDDDTYITRVRESGMLDEARRNVFLWRIYVLERTCALTFALLKRRGLLDEAVSTFMALENISPMRETQTPAFLEMLTRHSDSIVASVAQFELAMWKLREGDKGPYTIRFTTDPGPLLKNLAGDLPIDDIAQTGDYVIELTA